MAHTNTLGLGLSQRLDDHKIRIIAIPKSAPLSIETPKKETPPPAAAPKAAPKADDKKKVITIRIKSKMLKRWLEKRIEQEKKKKAKLAGAGAADRV